MPDPFDLIDPFADDPEWSNPPEPPDGGEPPDDPAPPDEFNGEQPDEGDGELPEDDDYPEDDPDEDPGDDPGDDPDDDPDEDPGEDLDEDPDEAWSDFPDAPPELPFDDRSAKELIRDLPPRRVAGESLADRVYARRVSAPGSARRAKLFERLGIGDPWDQDSKERSIVLGPVGTRLDEKRSVAPHALPKAPAAPTGPKLPDAPRAAPRPPITPAPTAAPAVKPKPTGPIDRTPPPPMPPSRNPAPVVKNHTPAAGRTAPKPAIRSKSVPQGGHAPPVIAAPQRAEEPKMGPGGRLRMSASAPSNSGPKVIAIPKLEEKYEGPGAVPAEQKAPEPPELSRKPPGGDMGLDDLFGFAQNEGRMRIRRPKKGEDEPKGG